ncbi:MAG: sodium:proton antiporter, partial [Candidatus Omnitrophica bacterium]|nr:sodium:proton antiporter [Candidatus Omnitrophota bacterium]
MRLVTGVLFALALLVSWYVGRTVPATWTVESVALHVHQDEEGKDYFTYKGKPLYLENPVPFQEAQLNPERIHEYNQAGIGPPVQKEFAFKTETHNGEEEKLYYQLTAQRHWRFWSLLPAAVAVLLCWITREPVTALFGGIVSGAFLLGKFDLTEMVLVENLASKDAAGILILYLWMLGGLLGIWSRTGAAQAFADLMTEKFVQGPKTAKLVAWFLGIIFFQGGTVSTVLVGTTVKPLADKERIAHEELAYIVDSTASPIASQLAFNAWPGYVQAFIFVAGVPWLATESDRIAFFFKSVPFCFYAIFAVLFTFLLSIDRSPFLGKKMKAAIKRARETGELDAPDAEPLA